MPEEQPSVTPTPAPAQPAAPQAEVDELLSLFREYGKPVALGCGAALLIYLAFVGYDVRKKARAERASQQLATANSVEQLQEIVRAYGATPSGPAAQLALAMSYLHSGQYAMAQEAYTQFESRYPDHLMLPAARIGQAYCAEANGLPDQAITLFTAFGEQYADNFLAPLAVLGRGRCLEQLGRHEEAKAIYEDFIAGNPDNPWTAQAETALLYVQKEIRARQAPAAPAAEAPKADAPQAEAQP